MLEIEIMSSINDVWKQDWTFCLFKDTRHDQIGRSRHLHIGQEISLSAAAKSTAPLTRVFALDSTIQERLCKLDEIGSSRRR